MIIQKEPKLILEIIFCRCFKESINRINNNLFDKVISELIREIADLTNNSKDKGQVFFESLPPIKA